MARNVPIDVELNNNREQCIDTRIPDQYQIEIEAENSDNYPVEIKTGCPNGKVPFGGLPGQVLTKFEKFYKWADNPLTVSTFDSLPENPTTHCLYLIEDVQRLVHWTGTEWVYINTDSELLYDEDEEMIYIEERHEY